MPSLNDIYDKIEDVGLKLERNSTQIETIQHQITQVNTKLANWSDNGCATGRFNSEKIAHNKAEIDKLTERVNVVVQEVTDTKAKTTLIGAFISLVVTVFANWFAHGK